MAFNRTIRFPGLGGPPGVSLTVTLGDYFSHPSRTRGDSYYLQGRVVITKGSPTIVTSRVRGTRPYHVSLEYSGHVLKVRCECEYYLSSGACKHIWATLLAGEGQTFLSAATADPLIVIEDHADAGTDAGTMTEPGSGQPPSKRLDWRKQVGEISRQTTSETVNTFNRLVWPDRRQVVYVINEAGSRSAKGILLNLESRDRKTDGTLARPVALRLKRGQIGQLPLAEDREAITAVAGGRQHSSFTVGYEYDTVPDSCHLTPELARIVLPLAIRTGRCLLRRGQAVETGPLVWDEGGEWRMTLEMRRTTRGWATAGVLQRGDERMELSEPALITAGGFVFLPDRVAPLAKNTNIEWLLWLRSNGILEASEQDRDELLGYLLCTPGVPEIEIPQELRFEQSTAAPQPRLRFRGLDTTDRSGRLWATLSFDYEGRIVEERAVESGFFDAANRRLVRRDLAAEQECARSLGELGMRLQGVYGRDPFEAWELAPAKLPGLVRALTGRNWHIEADGKTFRPAGNFQLKISSGLDWFELQGDVEYGDQVVHLPELLAAARRGDNMVRLGDGSYGLLPEEWLRRIATVAGMGTAEDGHVRFRRSQAGLLDALLAAQPEARCDELFDRVRAELQTFGGITAVDQPAGFQGQLRDYQLEGLGWIEFLRRFSFGGCLADDMGTGKTAQVLALLESRRSEKVKGRKKQPSLVVVPRSLVFNWKEESARFTPKLKILDYSGPERDITAISGHDLVLTTYGTLRRDITELKDIRFDYAVLDEAQMVKNGGTEGAKAVRLINAEYRLALSGTPVENHLGELWSMFEFLNPGMLGAASVFRLAGSAARNPDEGTRQLLAQALRPFILRRTKEQVARELPARTEQTIYCELEPEQRKLYNELRNHYRDSLRTRIAVEGLAKSKIMVLEALLRLRQAACHPGLIDKKRVHEPSAKVDALLEQLEEVLESGHKALVFSQFTSLLSIVRARLDERGVVYEYLDGKTRDRQARVERFQNDTDCKLFLISLKAGGLGLNLTAADYVFLLDPWWNPAVEAQAIDRAHRIGQVRQVSAYRLIARDTVEEKVLELQKTKRDLAAAIIGANNSVLKDLGREDLELLLS